MAKTRSNRRLIGLLCSAAIVGAVGYGFSLKPAAAQEAGSQSIGVQTDARPADMPPVPVDFSDPKEPLTRQNAVGVTVHENPPARFLPSAHDASTGDGRGYEVQVTADGDSVGVPVDLSIAHRGNFDADAAGNLSRLGGGSELRIGHGFANQPAAAAGIRRRAPSPGWYAFAASDNQALTWNPGTHNAFGDHGSSFGLEDRVEIGDHQAGVTYETGSGVQASLAYVERDVYAHVGNQSFSRAENFAGVTVTMRH